MASSSKVVLSSQGSDYDVDVIDNFTFVSFDSWEDMERVPQGWTPLFKNAVTPRRKRGRPPKSRLVSVPRLTLKDVCRAYAKQRLVSVRRQLVLARLHNHPFWPGVVLVHDGEIIVRYLGEASYSNLDETEIKEFELGAATSKYSPKPKTKARHDYLNAIQEARFLLKTHHTGPNWSLGNSRKGFKRSFVHSTPTEGKISSRNWPSKVNGHDLCLKIDNEDFAGEDDIQRPKDQNCGKCPACKSMLRFGGKIKRKKKFCVGNVSKEEEKFVISQDQRKFQLRSLSSIYSLKDGMAKQPALLVDDLSKTRVERLVCEPDLAPMLGNGLHLLQEFQKQEVSKEKQIATKSYDPWNDHSNDDPVPPHIQDPSQILAAVELMRKPKNGDKDATVVRTRRKRHRRPPKQFTAQSESRVPRGKFSSDHLAVLFEAYAENPNPSLLQIMKLSSKLGFENCEKVQKWFYRQRHQAKEESKYLERLSSIKRLDSSGESVQSSPEGQKRYSFRDFANIKGYVIVTGDDYDSSDNDVDDDIVAVIASDHTYSKRIV